MEHSSSPDAGARADGTVVQEVAARTALALPGAGLSHPFGPEHDVFKVAGKVFLMATEATGQPIVTLKCDPEEARALRRQFAAITPGYHVDKRHWVSVAAGEGVTGELVAELVVDSYLLVLDGLPRARRPVLPDELARAARGGGRPVPPAPR
ncbi:MmcQ/YjbR family DNA-binding protein [Kineococcus indalonis]|uniref:MmcQ/YjbR family DNA-binding protein n=1 Tax=Kineococcus indalonis TaxID=2696566 RepID=UPI001412EF40|nr:MmcQ/YjbR family DNA-binding protein [Kineococcus indalonis]NAZ88140.1 MmcQ/YjbR family DNA-binding protein [Kineococcus indalonis]